MQGVSINGHKLHEVQMLLEPYGNDNGSYQTYPKHRIQCSENGEDFIIKIPSLLVLELYRKSILSQEPTAIILVKMGGKKIGDFNLVDFRYPNHGEMITLTLQKVRKK